MAVWVVIPSADVAKARKAVEAWHGQGYRVCVGLDEFAITEADDHWFVCTIEGDDRVLGTWPGYPAAANAMLARVMSLDQDCMVAVAAADDMLPDPSYSAKAIEAQFLARMSETSASGVLVMQPCGDDWMSHAASRICGSPWVSRKWAMDGYEGRGAFWPEYRHFYADEELWNVANDHGFLWLRYDLAQYHDHWTRRKEPTPAYMEGKQLTWGFDQEMFRARRERQFPCWKALA